MPIEDKIKTSEPFIYLKEAQHFSLNNYMQWKVILFPLVSNYFSYCPPIFAKRVRYAHDLFSKLWAQWLLFRFCVNSVTKSISSFIKHLQNCHQGFQVLWVAQHVPGQRYPGSAEPGQTQQTEEMTPHSCLSLVPKE